MYEGWNKLNDNIKPIGIVALVPSRLQDFDTNIHLF
jgi:hypothetical protein